LPGIDDGPADMEAGLQMAALAGADGTEVIVATPHQKDVVEESSVDALRGLFDRFSGAVTAAGGPRMVLGMENHIEPELPDWVREGRALTLNGSKFILCEPDTETYPLYMDDTLFRLQQQGLVPIIAHPERCFVFQKQPERLAALVRRGMLVQITGSSLTGEFEGAARRAAEAFLKRGLVHMVASDMHRPERVRLPCLATAHARVAELAGADTARRVFEEIPRCVVENRDPGIDPFAELPSRRPWWRFGR
jgi:protein-tyrosine phosphatase